jgi:hypothetical protein
LVILGAMKVNFLDYILCRDLYDSGRSLYAVDDQAGDALATLLSNDNVRQLAPISTCEIFIPSRF